MHLNDIGGFSGLAYQSKISFVSRFRRGITSIVVGTQNLP